MKRKTSFLGVVRKCYIWPYQGSLNTETFVFQDVPFKRVTEAGLSIRDEIFHTLEAFKALETLPDILPGHSSFPRTLQTFYEFKCQVNTMANSMDKIEKHLSGKTLRQKLVMDNRKRKEKPLLWISALHILCR